MDILDKENTSFDQVYDCFITLDIDQKLVELEKLIDGTDYEMYSERFIEFLYDTRKQVETDTEQRKLVEFYHKIETDYPVVFKSVRDYATPDIYHMALSTGMIKIANKYQQQLLEGGMLFEIFYSSIYFNHFENIFQWFFEKQQQLSENLVYIDTFFQHYYILRTLLLERDEYKVADVKEVFEFVEKLRGDKLRELRTYRKWLLGEKSHQWRDHHFDRSESSEIERNCQLLSYEFLHFLWSDSDDSEISLAEAEVVRNVTYFIFLGHQGIKPRKRDLSRFRPRVNLYKKIIDNHITNSHADDMPYHLLLGGKYLPQLVDFLISKKLLREDHKMESLQELVGILNKIKRYITKSKYMLRELDIIKQEWIKIGIDSSRL